MTGLDKQEPPRCWYTEAVKLTTCARVIEADDQPDTIGMMEAGVYRQPSNRTDWCE